MMKIIIEIITQLLPVILTILGTFLITKYTYDKNRPLDKIEIAYNRFYYPLYNLIMQFDIPDEKFIENCETYFKKYRMYIEKNTLSTFNYLKMHMKSSDAYESFKNNILRNDHIMRRQLGYPEPATILFYKFASVYDRWLMRVGAELIVMYGAALLCGWIQNVWWILLWSFVVILALIFFVLDVVLTMRKGYRRYKKYRLIT